MKFFSSKKAIALNVVLAALVLLLGGGGGGGGGGRDGKRGGAILPVVMASPSPLRRSIYINNKKTADADANDGHPQLVSIIGGGNGSGGFLSASAASSPGYLSSLVGGSKGEANEDDVVRFVCRSAL